MEAFAQAYPKRISNPEFRDGDWSLMLMGQRYFYAEGRMLPEEFRDKTEEYAAQSFYTYPLELPAWTEPDASTQERYRTIREDRQRSKFRRSPHFFDALWRASTQDEAYERQKTILFLGRQILVHNMILEEIAQVEEKIKEAARTDETVRSWMNRIGRIEAYNWRAIADIDSRSFHSYGAAVDITPVSYGGLATYWLWSSDYTDEWWNIPYSQRYHPPEAVIKAFESSGFVWGGKWVLFDTMHFEYRPEVLILNGIPLHTWHE